MGYTLGLAYREALQDLGQNAKNYLDFHVSFADRSKIPRTDNFIAES